ncbi:MAG: DUF2158 domain-containing protein [Defluviicoccus sp.]|nr:DUF2158 domain-containing protein [Defluviicoccus sp.]MDE0383430.1 DUF2158 domain-containing protein [Defluviicoccus sp.]
MSQTADHSLIEVGSVVQIRSGGPVMTVIAIEPPAIAVCKWYDMIWNTERFPVAALRAVPEPAQATRPGLSSVR